jgi:tetratricopeptide (TPR) repeat protein
MSLGRRKSKVSPSTVSEQDAVGCIGRDHELLRLGACLDRIENGRGCFAVVSAPAGTGKTHLLNQFAAMAGHDGRLLAHVHLGPSASRPYEIWRRVVNSLAAQGIRPPDGMTPAYRTVLKRLRQYGRPSAGDDERLPPLSAEQVRYRLYDAVWQLLRSACGRKPLVVLIDDLQFADAPSLTLLRHLLAFFPSAPILLAATFDDADPRWTALAQLRGAVPHDLHFETIVLDGLSPLGIRELIWRLGMENVGSAGSSQIAELTRGSPLHILLLAQLLGAQGPDALTCTQEQGLGELGLFASSAHRSFTHIVASQLPPLQRDILEAAAVFPEQFHKADVAALVGTDRASAASALNSLVARGVLKPSENAKGNYRFRHQMFRESMLERLDLHARSVLTRRTLALKSGSVKDAADAWQLADWSHAVRAFPEARTGRRYCRLVTQQAQWVSSPELAAQNLAKELDLMQAAGETDVALLSEHALAAADVGSFEDAARSAWRAVDALGGEEDGPSRTLDSLVDFAMHFHDSGAGPAIWESFRNAAMAALGGVTDLRWARLRLLDGGDMQRISGPPLHVGRWMGLDSQAVKIARDDGDEHDYCRTLFVYDWHSVADIDALLEMAENWSSTADVARALSVAAETLMYRHGQFDRACELLERQRSLHEQTGSIVEQAKSLVRLTMGLLAAGELETAISTRDRARDMVDRLGPGYLIYEHAGTTRGGDLYPEISMESNFAWYIEGNWLAVAEHWAHAIGHEEPGGSPVHIVETAMAAQAYARINRFEEARFYLDELTGVLRRLEPRDWAFNGAVGRASHAIWDMAAVEYANEYRDHALHILAAGVGDWTNTSLELTVARMAALLGHAEEARNYFQAATQRLVEKKADPRRAIIDFDEAVSLRLLKSADVSRRRSLLENARSSFEHRKMNGWSRRMKEELLRT